MLALVNVVVDRIYCTDVVSCVNVEFLVEFYNNKSWGI
jgi:hypothetical protein